MLELSWCGPLFFLEEPEEKHKFLIKKSIYYNNTLAQILEALVNEERWLPATDDTH